MGSQRVRVLFVAAVTACAAMGCADGDRSSGNAGGEDVLAVVNGVPVTRADIEDHVSRMAPEIQQEFKSPSTLSALIDREVSMRLWAAAGREAGLADTDEYKYQMKTAEMTILADLYTRGVTGGTSKISEQELLETYEREKHLYTRGGESHARHILCATEQEANEALNAVRGGMPFEEAVLKYSADTMTKAKAGDLGRITPTSVIPGLGAAPDFVEEISKVEPGGVGGPFRTRRGFHVVQVLERTPSEVRSFAEMKGQIEKRLAKERSEGGRVADLEALRKKFNVEINHEAIKRYIGYPVTPEEFIRHIREATSSGDKIRLCEDMVGQFPDNKYAPYALLTMGFVYSEELHNFVDADRVFKSLIEKYPSSNLVAAARWMLNNMQGQHPPLRNVEHVVEIAKGSGG